MTLSKHLLTHRPSMILARTRPSIFLPAIMFVWGLVTVGMGWVPTYRGLIGFRVVVGVLEAGFAPGVLLLLSSWYKKSEQSKRFAVYISAAILSGAFGGLLAGAITEGMDGVKGLAGWRWLFIVEGAATSAWSLVATFILLDFPANTKRLTDAERHLAILRLKSEALVHTEDQPALGHLAALKVALTNWRTWLFVVGYMVRQLELCILLLIHLLTLISTRPLSALPLSPTSIRPSSTVLVTTPTLPNT